MNATEVPSCSTLRSTVELQHAEKPDDGRRDIFPVVFYDCREEGWGIISKLRGAGDVLLGPV